MGAAVSAVQSSLKPAGLAAVVDDEQDRLDAKRWLPARNIEITKMQFGLSVRFQIDQERVTVGKFRRHDGEAGAAELSGRVGVGWAITMVDGCPIPRPATQEMCTEVADLVRAAPDVVKLRVMKPRPPPTAADEAAKKAAAWREKQRKAAGPLGRLFMDKFGEEAAGGAATGAAGAAGGSSRGSSSSADAVTAFDGGGGDGGDGGGGYAPDETPPNKLMAGVLEWQKGTYGHERFDFLPHTPTGRHVALDKAQRLVTWGSLEALRDQVIFNYHHMNMPNGRYQDTMLHSLCREGYAAGVAFLCDGRNRLGNARRLGIKFDAKNLDGRVPLQCAFTPPHMTHKEKGRGAFEAAVAAYGGGGVGGPGKGKEKGVRESQRGGGWGPVEMPRELMEPGGEAERTAIVKALVGAGASAAVKDRDEVTLLHYAAVWGWAECCGYLLTAGNVPGAAVDSRHGRTALMVACERGHVAAARELVKQDQLLAGHVAAKDNHGSNALTLAAGSKGADELVPLLLDAGAAPDVPNRRDETPLMLCCRKGRARAMSALLHLPGVGRRKEAVAEIADERQRKDIRDKLKRGYFAPVDEKEKARRKAKQAAREETSRKGQEVGLTVEDLEHAQDALDALEKAAAERGEAVSNREKYRRQGAWERRHDPLKGARVFYFNHDTKAVQFDAPPGWKDDPTYIPVCSCCGVPVTLTANGHGRMHHVSRGGQSRWVHRAD